MRICVMVALLIIGLNVDMPWYYWAVMGLDVAVIFCKSAYKAGKKETPPVK